ALTALIPLLALATPALAATKEQKMETCKVGADSDNLTGAKRDAFMKKCMGSGNYEPAARKEAMKKAAAEKKMKKKPAPKAAAVPPPPDAEAKPKQ
ncbi:MAG TPA: PsiF family protein, partial [Pseudolabrys sp.]|nr:PsiF family protein [Pseudolabrys sp.]